MTNIRKTLTALTVVGTATLGLAGLASAEEVTSSTTATTTAPAATGAIAPAATSTTTLPLFGASLIIDITVGPDGGLDAVNINHSTETWTADKVKPNKVSFINDAGTVRVVVKANDGGQRVAVKAATLADITGAGEWKGDVFEDGGQSIVLYEIGGSPDAPTITIGNITVPTSIVATPIASKVSTDDDDEEISVRAGVKFTSGTSTRTLTISVEVHQGVETDDDDSHEGAQLRVTLGRIHTRALVGAEAVVGTHTWNGTLCDGTKVTVGYSVDGNGVVTVTTPGLAVETKNNGARVTFTDGSKLSIKVEADHDDENTDQMRLREQFKIRCERENPILNVPTATTDGRDKHEDDDHSEDDRKGREERRNDTSRTTITTRSGDKSTSTTSDDDDHDNDDHDDKRGKDNDD